MASVEALTGTRKNAPKKLTLARAVIRFAGDSGDGMQITGGQFTNTSALFGNDLATFPDYPAEIRAPAGTLPGVSGFQIHFASEDVYTPGDTTDALIAMNPAALKMNVQDLKTGGILIVNTDNFEATDLRKAQMTVNPLEDHSLDGYRLFSVALATLTRAALKDLGLDAKSMDRCKNFFALGMCYWLFNRPLDSTSNWLDKKFKKKPALAEANKLALRAGYAYCDATEAFQESYEIPAAKLPPGVYRNISGNAATALGLVAAGQRSGLPVFQGSYPITPASDILHELSHYKNFGVTTFQAEDEIAAMASVVGAAYAGQLAVTTTSGPGMALKAEAIGLAIMIELPVVIINVQRGGPSTGLPTRTEQADLFQALYGRNGEAPIPVLAAMSPGDCFWIALEASRLALKYMTPVVMLTDGYLANGAEPWKLPRLEDLPTFPVRFHSEVEGFQPYDRNPDTLARNWAIPGTPGLEHRVGGLEKQEGTGHVSYDAANHERMTHIRANKVAGMVQDVPDAVPEGDPEGELLVIGWGSTYGAITAAVRAHRARGSQIGHLQLRHINPMPANLGELMKRYAHVLVPEINMGQLSFVLRATYLVDVHAFNKVQGKPFTVSDVEAKITEVLK
jgi:2-oxoglutarate ferredoxin oxidoreductase subunit alpha